MLHAWSSSRYTFPLPQGHRFPIEKYALLRERVLAEGIVAPADLHEPARASRDDLRLVHTADYIDRFTRGELSPDEVRKLGFPWSEALVERSYRAAGGSIEAARHAVALDPKELAEHPLQVGLSMKVEVWNSPHGPRNPSSKDMMTSD